VKILTRQKCYSREGRGVSPEAVSPEASAVCSTCKGNGYIEKWMTIDAFLEAFIKPEALR
jgi:DnaJ-class molecular chaperone